MAAEAGKGDGRRSTQVSDKQLTDNWNMTFGNRRVSEDFSNSFKQIFGEEKPKCGNDCNTCGCKSKEVATS